MTDSEFDYEIVRPLTALERSLMAPEVEALQEVEARRQEISDRLTRMGMLIAPEMAEPGSPVFIHMEAGEIRRRPVIPPAPFMDPSLTAEGFMEKMEEAANVVSVGFTGVHATGTTFVAPPPPEP